MKWCVHWLSLLGLSYLPGGRKLHRWLQDRLGEHRHLETSTRFENAELLVRATHRLTRDIADPHIVEIGTGWIPAIPLALLLSGLRVHSYDISRHVDRGLFVRTRDVLNRRRLAVAAGVAVEIIDQRARAISAIDDFAAAAECLGGRYAAPVDTTALPEADGQTDVVVSNLVLQCIPNELLRSVLDETYRVLKPGGHAVHRIYLGDEYAGRDPQRDRLHFLTYSERTWRRWFCHRLKHLNRLRAPQFLAMFAEIGFELKHAASNVSHSSIPHLQRIGVDESFRGLSWEEISTTSLEVTLRKPEAPTATASSAAECRSPASATAR